MLPRALVPAVACVLACEGAAEPLAERERTEVPVPAPTARYLTVTPAKARIDRGGMLRLEAIALDAERRVLPRADIHWTSADTALATVDQGGVVRAVSAGYVAIGAWSGAAAAQALLQIGVDGEYPTGVVLQPALATLPACGSYVFRALTDPDIHDTRFGWTSSDPAVMRVEAPGTLRGVTPGSAQLTVAWLPDSSRRAVRTFTITPCP